MFFCPEDMPYLYPRYPHSLDPCFDVNLSSPDFSKHPLLSLARPRECILRPGKSSDPVNGFDVTIKIKKIQLKL